MKFSCICAILQVLVGGEKKTVGQIVQEMGEPLAGDRKLIRCLTANRNYWLFYLMETELNCISKTEDGRYFFDSSAEHYHYDGEFGGGQMDAQVREVVRGLEQRATSLL